MAQQNTKTRPVHEIRLGRIRAAIWKNEHHSSAGHTGTRQTFTQHSVTVSRLYKDGDHWKDSSSFGRDDLPLVGKVLDRAHSWIFEHAGNGGGESE